MTAEMLMEDCERKDRIRKRGFMILHTVTAVSMEDADVREIYIDYSRIAMIKGEEENEYFKAFEKMMKK